MELNSVELFHRNEHWSDLWKSFSKQNNSPRTLKMNSYREKKKTATLIPDEGKKTNLCIFLIRLEHFILMSLPSFPFCMCPVEKCSSVQRLWEQYHFEKRASFDAFVLFYFINFHTISFQSTESVPSLIRFYLVHFCPCHPPEK